MAGREKTFTIRMSESQHARLESFQRRVCAPSISAACRAAIELGMASVDREAGIVGEDGTITLTFRGGQ